MAKKKNIDENYETISVTVTPSQLKRIDEGCKLSYYRSRSSFMVYASVLEAEREIRARKKVV